jgi:hypothetical protein
MHGDGFASPLEEGGYFKLIIHGFNENYEDIGNTVEYMLAEFTNGKLIQSADWEWIDLSSQGEVYGFYFTMQSSDIHKIVELGPNTAVYFCMDRLTVTPVSTEIKVPGRPVNLSATATEMTIDFSWRAGSGAAPTGYNVYLDGEFTASVSVPAYMFEGLHPATEYRIGVEAFNEEGVSAKAYITVSTIDETPPTRPENLHAATITATSIEITWTASTDNVAVTGYNIYVDGARVKRVTETTYTIALLDPETNYTVEVEAIDAAGNRSERASLTVSTVSTLSVTPDTQMAYVRIYPNPFADVLLIETDTDLQIDIYDVTGRKALSKHLTRGINRIDCSSLPHGIYILKYGNMSGKVIKR